MSEVRVEIDAIVRHFMAHEVTVGLALGLLSNDSADFLSYGHSIVGKDGAPDENAIFELGSVTKTFTGLLLAQCVQKGLVRLDDIIAQYLPQGAVSLDGSANKITLRQLATHSSGLPNHARNMRYSDPQRLPYSIADLYAGLSDCALVFEPGTARAYSNLGMILLGHVLELAAGRAYEQLLTEWICLPLGMESTFVTAKSARQKARLCPGYTDEFAPVAAVEEPFTPGCGEIRSSAADMLKYLSAFLFPERSAIGAAALEATKDHCHPHGVGLGWFREEDGACIWHSGQTLGFRCLCEFDPHRPVGYVLLSNTGTALIDHLRAPLMEVLRTGTCAKPVAFPIPPVVPVRPDALARLAGTYRHEENPNLHLLICHEGGRLTAQFVMNMNFPQVRLYPYSETEFFYRPKPRHFRFLLNEEGRAERLFVTGADKNGSYVRIEATAE